MSQSIPMSRAAESLFRRHQQAVYQRTDRTFAVLMIAQWFAGAAAAIWISPRTWSGTVSSLHPHVLAAVLLGGVITSLPVFLALRRPGEALTRHVIAVSQMLISALLIHLTGGRIETHFHVFGSLAFLACYRDWRVLVSATIVIVADHLIRGIVWPYSVYGVLSASIWRSFEHAGWVVFEDLFLCVAIRQSVDEMRNTAIASQAQRETASELHKSEDALRKQAHVLETANLSKTQFLANMSHEIRTPLGSILGFTDLLRRRIGTEEQRQGYLDAIRTSGRHLSALIDDVLDISKIEAGRMEFERVACSPHQVITEVLSVLRVRAQEKSLTLECDWSGPIPETIQTDPARLRQLLTNLVGNAIKFTERGGVRLLASATWDASQPRFVVEIHDTGIGIAADRTERIFSAFEQADSSITRRFGGTGLGLAISRRIAEGLGGEITVSSQLDRGSVFRVTLPTGPLGQARVASGTTSEALIPQDASKSGLPIDLTGVQVLLVEDGQSNRELIGLVLREAGAEVATAENGRLGLEAARRGQFDVILMDMQMPVMDGYSATERLRDDGYQLPIIALTAHAMRGDREKCLQAGCTGYLSKPIDIDELLRTVAETLPRTGRTPGATTTLGASRPANGRVADADTIVSSLPGDNPNFRPIVESFVERLHAEIAQMRAACGSQDWDKLAERAHWLHGSGGTLGFACFTEPARRLGKLARERQADEAERVIEEISTLIERIMVPA